MITRAAIIMLLLALVATFLAFPVGARDAARGAKLAASHCGTCHATEKSGTSPNLKAPTFRRIARQWPLDQLQEALAEGIVTGHAAMPEFRFEPGEIDDLLAHLARLKRR